MATLTSIEAKVLQNVIDLPADTSGRIRDWVNEACEVASERIFWRGLKTDLQYTTVASTQLLGTLPASAALVAARGTPYYLRGDGSTVEMEWAYSDEEINKEFPRLDVTNTGRPQMLYFDVTNLQVLVFPYPDRLNLLGTYSVSGDYLIKIPVSAYAAVLNDAIQTNFFTLGPILARYVEDYATGQAMLFNHDVQNAQLYLTKAQGYLLRAMRTEKRAQMQGWRITPRRDVSGRRRQRRM